MSSLMLPQEDAEKKVKTSDEARDELRAKFTKDKNRRSAKQRAEELESAVRAAKAAADRPAETENTKPLKLRLAEAAYQAYGETHAKRK